jgi:hypothetical protein
LTSKPDRDIVTAQMLSYPHILALVFIYSLYAAGCVAFGIYYAKENGGTPKAATKGILAALLLLVLGALHGLLGVGAMVAATFYVADRKNRSRSWAALAMFFGPIALLIVTLLPKQAETKLSLT